MTSELLAKTELFTGADEPLGAVVDGAWTPTSGDPLTVEDPATREPLARFTDSTEADVDRAVVSADRAYREVWRDLGGVRRADILFAVADTIRDGNLPPLMIEPIDFQGLYRAKQAEMTQTGGSFQTN